MLFDGATWRVFGSIAAQTGINLTELEQLNPRLKATTLQPGDQLKLRP